MKASIMSNKFTDYISSFFVGAKSATADIHWPKTIWRNTVAATSHVVMSVALAGACVDFFTWHAGPIDSSVTPPIPPGTPLEVMPDDFFNYMAALFLVKMVFGIGVYMSGLALGVYRYGPVRKSYIEAMNSMPVVCAPRQPRRSPDQ